DPLVKRLMTMVGDAGLYEVVFVGNESEGVPENGGKNNHTSESGVAVLEIELKSNEDGTDIVRYRLNGGLVRLGELEKALRALLEASPDMVLQAPAYRVPDPIVGSNSIDVAESKSVYSAELAALNKALVQAKAAGVKHIQQVD
ncbi:MAG TPA: hypothetical protein VJ952_02035, partial [Opitutales bacterium]|nr:hypothetical protein [Opitutales bacterium]